MCWIFVRKRGLELITFPKFIFSGGCESRPGEYIHWSVWINKFNFKDCILLKARVFYQATMDYWIFCTKTVITQKIIIRICPNFFMVEGNTCAGYWKKLTISKYIHNVEIFGGEGGAEALKAFQISWFVVIYVQHVRSICWPIITSQLWNSANLLPGLTFF